MRATGLPWPDVNLAVLFAMLNSILSILLPDCTQQEPKRAKREQARPGRQSRSAPKPGASSTGRMPDPPAAKVPKTPDPFETLGLKRDGEGVAEDDGAHCAPSHLLCLKRPTPRSQKAY